MTTWRGKVRLPVRDRRGQILARLDDVTLLGVDADDDLEPLPQADGRAAGRAKAARTQAAEAGRRTSQTLGSRNPSARSQPWSGHRTVQVSGRATPVAVHRWGHPMAHRSHAPDALGPDR